MNALLGEANGTEHCELDPLSTDEQLSPVEKLEKFIDCEHSYSRYKVMLLIDYYWCCCLHTSNIFHHDIWETK